LGEGKEKKKKRREKKKKKKESKERKSHCYQQLFIQHSDERFFLLVRLFIFFCGDNNEKE